MRRQGWHREDIKAAIRKTGVTLSQLALDSGLAECAVRLALINPYYPAADRVISTYLGIHPQELWPHRYDKDGTRTIGRSLPKHTGKIETGHRQKRKAA